MFTVHSHKTFYAIGQGGFYSEELIHDNEKKVIVYDCGSLSPRARIKSEISQFPYKDIDYLIISHLDADHINCIDFLAQGRNIKKIILPHTNPLDLLFFYFNCNDQDALNSFFNTIQSHQHIEVNADEENPDVPEYINDNEDARILQYEDTDSCKALWDQYYRKTLFYKTRTLEQPKHFYTQSASHESSYCVL